MLLHVPGQTGDLEALLNENVNEADAHALVSMLRALAGDAMFAMTRCSLSNTAKISFGDTFGLTGLIDRRQPAEHAASHEIFDFW